MKLKHLTILTLFVLSLGLNAHTYDPQKKATIEEIISNPGAYVNEFVTIEGFVTQYTPKNAATTANYLIKGDYGSVMTINTSGSEPVINDKYRVAGTIIIDPYTSLPYMVEQTRVPLKIIIEPPKDHSTSLPFWLYMVIGILGVGLILLIVLIATREKEVVGVKEKPSATGITEPDYNNDFKTVKIVTQQAPKTMVYIPGKLEIMNGNDAGKQFVLAAYPAPSGPTVTIGSREETGERKFSHIRLLEKTVSRAQAELIYKEKKLYIKNLSNTNFTQLNGSDLRPDETGEVIPESKIRVGEIVFQYHA